MFRFSLWAVLVVSCGCSGSKFDPEQARARLIEQVGQIRKAVLEKDHELMARLTHPGLVAAAGGKAKYVQLLNKATTEVEGQGFRLVDATMAEPTPIVERASGHYALVPYSLSLSGPGGEKGEKPSCFIAVSTDRGLNWVFLDGEGVAGDRARLLRMMPDFPPEIKLPPVQRAKWKQ
jgi:hypothetical protein